MDLAQKISLSGTFIFLMALLLNLSDRSMAQISSDRERIGCVEVNMVRTCFDIYNLSSTWNDAWLQCLANDSQLALLETSEVDNLVGQYMEQITQNFDNDFPVWIGGRQLDDSTWKWTGGEIFLAQNISQMTTLFSANPSRYENCAAIGLNQSTATATLVFQSIQCKNPRPFICQQNYSEVSNQTSTCEVGSNVGVVVGDQCYAVVSTTSGPMTWFDALLECSKINAVLAVFNESSPEERQAIMSLLPNSTQTFWIGLRKLPWVWTTDFDSEKLAVTQWKEMLYTGWGLGIPYQRSRNCLAMQGDSGGVSHGWINMRCDETHPFICHQKTLLTTTPPPTTAGTIASGSFGNENETETTSEPRKWSLDRSLVSILVPCAIVAVVIIVIGFGLFFYFSQRRGGYEQQP